MVLHGMVVHIQPSRIVGQYGITYKLWCRLRWGQVQQIKRHTYIHIAHHGFSQLVIFVDDTSVFFQSGVAKVNDSVFHINFFRCVKRFKVNAIPINDLHEGLPNLLDPKNNGSRGGKNHVGVVLQALFPKIIRCQIGNLLGSPSTFNGRGGLCEQGVSFFKVPDGFPCTLWVNIIATGHSLLQSFGQAFDHTWFHDQSRSHYQIIVGNVPAAFG